MQQILKKYMPLIMPLPKPLLFKIPKISGKHLKILSLLSSKEEEKKFIISPITKEMKSIF